MDSLTKNKKTEHEIVRLVNQSLYLDTDIVEVSELTDGSFNAVYKIVSANGNHYVLKIAPTAAAPILRNEKNIMASEAAALRLIQKHTSVPVPEVLYNSDKASACDSPFLIMEWMDGKSYQAVSHSYSDEANKKILSELGSAVYLFHQIQGTEFGPLCNAEYQFPTWSEAFSALYQNILEDGIDAGVTLPLDYDDLFQLGEKGRACLNDVTIPCLIHGDLWPGNILVQDEKITALLDFERALWGDPLMEYPFGLLRNNTSFLDGYKHFILDASDVSAQIRRSLYNLYYYLIVKIEKAYRGFKSGNSDYFVNQKMIAEVRAIEKLLSR